MPNWEGPVVYYGSSEEQDRIQMQAALNLTLFPYLFRALTAADYNLLHCSNEQPELATVPSDAAVLGEVYGKPALPIPAEIFQLHLTDVYSLDDFYIQLHGEGTTVALKQIWENLNAFYNSTEGNSYSMRSEQIVKDAVCAATMTTRANTWFRCVIIEVAPDSSSVKVLYVDYGRKVIIEKTNLRYLKRDFMALPAQAIRSRMAFILQGYSAAWDKRPGNRLEEVCYDKVLKAQVCPNDMYPDCLSLWLCDCSEAYTIYINKLLVDENLVRYSAEELEKTLSESSSIFQTPSKSSLLGPHQVFSKLVTYQNPAFGSELSPNIEEMLKDTLWKEILIMDIDTLMDKCRKLGTI